MPCCRIACTAFIVGFLSFVSDYECMHILSYHFITFVLSLVSDHEEYISFLFCSVRVFSSCASWLDSIANFFRAGYFSAFLLYYAMMASSLFALLKGKCKMEVGTHRGSHFLRNQESATSCSCVRISFTRTSLLIILECFR